MMTASFDAKIKGWILVCFVCLFVFFCPFLGGGKGEILEITTRRLKTTFYGHFSAKKQAGKWINHKDYLSDMINISLNNIDINMGKITPNRIAFVILPEEVTLVLYILYILLGAREHIIHTYIHTYIATILLVTHVSNISLCTSAISRYCVAGGLFGQRQKNWAGKTRCALWLFLGFSQLFSHSRETNPRYADKAFLISCCCSIKKYLKPRTWIIK